jgi:hypothetical protein
MSEYKIGNELFVNYKFFFDIVGIKDNIVELQYYHKSGYPNTEINKANVALQLDQINFVEHRGNYIVVKISEKILKEKLGNVYDNLLIQEDVYLKLMKEDASMADANGPINVDLNVDTNDNNMAILNRKEFIKMNKGKGVVDLRHSKNMINTLSNMGKTLNKKYYPADMSKGYKKFDIPYVVTEISNYNEFVKNKNEEDDDDNIDLFFNLEQDRIDFNNNYEKKNKKLAKFL